MSRIDPPKTSGWNYRVMRRTYSDSDYVDFGIYEVYYDEEGNPNGWSTDPDPMVADSVEDLRWIHEQIAEALEKPVLDYGEHKFRRLGC